MTALIGQCWGHVMSVRPDFFDTRKHFVTCFIFWWQDFQSWAPQIIIISCIVATWVAALKLKVVTSQEMKGYISRGHCIIEIHWLQESCQPVSKHHVIRHHVSVYPLQVNPDQIWMCLLVWVSGSKTPEFSIILRRNTQNNACPILWSQQWLFVTSTATAFSIITLTLPIL